MKKIRQNSKKGFTLVELIVVLVILAVMAAMLVPALTGYIDEARKKKDYNAASEVLTAAQAVAAQYYGSDTTPTAAEAKAYITDARTIIIGNLYANKCNDIYFESRVMAKKCIEAIGEEDLMNTLKREDIMEIYCSMSQEGLGPIKWWE